MTNRRLGALLGCMLAQSSRITDVACFMFYAHEHCAFVGIFTDVFYESGQVTVAILLESFVTVSGRMERQDERAELEVRSAPRALTLSCSLARPSCLNLKIM